MARNVRLRKGFKDMMSNHDKYVGSCEELQNLLEPYIGFQITVQHLSSDGYVVMHNELYKNIRISTIIAMVESGEEITPEYFMTYGS